MNALDYLGIKVVQDSYQEMIMTMPITDKVRQPYGIVHGGMNAVLAETVASLAANAYLSDDRVALGVNINTQHLEGVEKGTLRAVAKPVRLGYRIMVYQVEITLAETGQLTSISTVTLTAKAASNFDHIS